MDEIDTVLARIAGLAPDARLDSIEHRVLRGAARERMRADGALPLTAFALAALIAFGSGLAGSALLPPRQTGAALFPLGAPPALAPSVLLGDAG